jgi:hypothetical protein
MTNKKRSGRSKGNPAGKPDDRASFTPEASGILSALGEEMMLACVDMVGRTGSEIFQSRYSDDEDPVVWMAVGKWGDRYEVGAATNPVTAAIRLLETVVDGGQCQNCGKPTGITEDFDDMPLDKMVCWYQYDPEMKKFRAGCAGGD